MTTDRSYSDNEVALILRRAMEMQQDPALPSDGLSLRQLRDIAREIGVDPELVTTAATQLPTASTGTFARVFGGNVHQETRLVHDAALSPERLQDLVMAIRSAMQRQGKTQELLGALEWTTVGDISQVAVTARAGGEKTTVHVIADRGAAAILTTVGSIGLGAFAAAIAGAIVEPGVVGGVALMGTGVAGGVAMARTIWIRTTHGFQQKLARLTERIQQTLDS